MSEGIPRHNTLKARAAKARSRPLSEEEINELRSNENFRTLNRQEQRHIEREYFGILNRQNVKFNSSAKRYELAYYTNDNPNSSRAVPLRQIATERSQPDSWYKIWIILVNLAVLIACAGAPFASESLAILEQMQLIPPNVSFEMVGFFVALILIAVFFLLSRNVENHLVHVDADWTNAINEAFNYTDVNVQMSGIRRLLLKFRQFIKWRRFVNFFLLFIITFSLIVVSTSVAVSAFSFSINISEGFFALLFLGGLLYLWYWLWWQVRVEHTEWRDPTVQLSIMVAGMHQRYVENKIVGVGGQQGHASSASVAR
jgi:hypothetical protein